MRPTPLLRRAIAVVVVLAAFAAAVLTASPSGAAAPRPTPLGRCLESFSSPASVQAGATITMHGTSFADLFQPGSCAALAYQAGVDMSPAVEAAAKGRPLSPGEVWGSVAVNYASQPTAGRSLIFLRAVDVAVWTQVRRIINANQMKVPVSSVVQNYKCGGLVYENGVSYVIRVTIADAPAAGRTPSRIEVEFGGNDWSTTPCW